MKTSMSHGELPIWFIILVIIGSLVALYCTLTGESGYDKQMRLLDEQPLCETFTAHDEYEYRCCNTCHDYGQRYYNSKYEYHRTGTINECFCFDPQSMRTTEVTI